MDFLGLTFYLNTGPYKSFNKPNNTLYKQNSTPPNVSKKQTFGIKQKVELYIFRQETFWRNGHCVLARTENSGYNHKLHFDDQCRGFKKKRSRKLNLIYFNPPYSAGVNTRVGAKVLKLVDTCLPPANPLQKYLTDIESKKLQNNTKYATNYYSTQ